MTFPTTPEVGRPLGHLAMGSEGPKVRWGHKLRAIVQRFEQRLVVQCGKVAREARTTKPGGREDKGVLCARDETTR